MSLETYILLFVGLFALFYIGIIMLVMAKMVKDRRFYEVCLYLKDAPLDVQRSMQWTFGKEAHDTKRKGLRRFNALGYRDEETGDSHISFERAVITLDRIYYKIAIAKLPEGLCLSQLVSEANLHEVSVAIEMPISTYITPQSGAWLVVCRPRWEDQPYHDRMLPKQKWSIPWPTKTRLALADEDKFIFDDDLQVAAETALIQEANRWA